MGEHGPMWITWPRYGVLASVHASQLREVRRRAGSSPAAAAASVVAGAGLVFPTFIDELQAARASVDLPGLIAVVLRRWRRATGRSQRAAAQAVDVAASRWARAETDAASLKLGDVLALVRASGHDLVVVSLDGGTPLRPGDLTKEELLARRAGGGRFSATSEVVQLTGEPRWMAERGRPYQTHGPQWTGEIFPGQR